MDTAVPPPAEPLPADTGGSPADAALPAPARPDRRRTRWAEHRRTRREELVEAALRAITRHGAGVGMDEIAATAGTSKTALYRHFTDKEALYLAVVARVNRLIVRELKAAVARATTPREALAGIIETYLRLVEQDPEVYRFVVKHPFLDREVSSDPVGGLTAAIGDETARTLTAQLRAAGAGSEATDALAHGLVGLIRAAADRWMAAPERLPAEVLARHLTTLAWGGLTAVLPVTDDIPGGPGTPGEPSTPGGPRTGATAVSAAPQHEEER
ncbi:AcrR family transcriptional regulator [Kineococcus xinjiangensis]|uniref:AcrR family transcriptional regulator n=1 Tax=Kineococcus xinjiangensis TaxID=512762 RepID=A0A2S6ID76_9ACTN|nr:TetR/AcrR family transcriptional regulator [Kineococcus xinjiangensis]PPK92120.1 AcrR family transcriptional regulator [Kineococcus xinjiangensis]